MLKPLLLGLLVIAPVHAWWPEPLLAPDEVDDIWLPEPVMTEMTPVTPAMLDRSRYWMAGYLDSLSGNLDRFFVDSFFSEDVLEDDVRGTRAKISLFSRRAGGEPVDYQFGFSLNLVLPNTNERLNLLIESEDDADSRETDVRRSVNNVSYSTALRFLLIDTAAWKTDFDTGVRWGVPPDPFARVRARRYDYWSDWELRTTQSLFYFTSNGWGEDTQVRMDYPLNTEKLFRINTRAGYQLNNDYFDLAYSVSLYHELTPRSALVYTAGASGDSAEGATFYDYFAGLRYRRQIYSNWIYAEIAPQFEWGRDRQYRTTPVLMLSIESVIAQDLF